MDLANSPGGSAADGETLRERLRSWRGVLAASTSLSTGLAGCGSDSEPTDTDTATEKPTATEEPTATSSTTPTPTMSDPVPLVVEDFAADSLSQYEGATDSFVLDMEYTLSGKYSLKDKSSWGDGSVYRTEGFEYAPRAGDTFRIGLYVRDYDREDFPFLGWFHWAIDEEEGIVDNPTGGFDPRNCYSISFDTRGNHTVHEHGDFVFSVHDTSGPWSRSVDEIKVPIEKPYPEGEWTDIEVDWGMDGSITITVFDADENAIASINATDDRYTSGGIGFRTDGGNSHFNYWDYVRIIDR